MTTTTDTVALYLRLSPRPDGHYEGVDRQESWGRTYAAKAWPGAPVRVFADTGLSAFNGGPRPAYEELRDAIVAGELAHVWAVEQSRLERDEIAWFELAAELAEHGIDAVHTDRDGIVRLDDVSSGIKAVLAAHESRRLRRRVNDALNDLAAGGRPGGAHHIGYRNVRNTEGRAALEIVPEAAEAIRWAADRVLAGWSLADVARDFERRGLATRNGGRWSHGNARGALTAPIVAGLRVHRGEVVGRGNWPPILDESTWRRVCAVLDRPERRPARSYLLSGIARCGRCGAGLTGRMQNGRGGRRPIYFCATTTGGCGGLGVNAEPLDVHVTDALLAELDKPAFRAAFADDDDHDAERERIDAELAEIEATRADLARRVGRREIRPDEWAEMRAQLDADEKRLRGELASVPAPIGPVDFDQVRQGWAGNTPAERRTLVGMFIEAVTVAPATPGAKRFDPARVSIEWASAR